MQSIAMVWQAGCVMQRSAMDWQLGYVTQRRVEAGFGWAVMVSEQCCVQHGPETAG